MSCNSCRRERLVDDARIALAILKPHEIAQVLQHVPGMRGTTLRSGKLKLSLTVDPPKPPKPLKRRRSRIPNHVDY